MRRWYPRSILPSFFTGSKRQREIQPSRTRLRRGIENNIDSSTVNIYLTRMRSLGRPDDPPSRFALAIFWINGLLMRSSEKITRSLGLSSAKWQVLGRAGDEPQPVAQMARDMGLARQSVQRVANVLEKQGLVTYKDNPTDRRAQLVELTGQGRKTLAAIYRRNAEWSDRMGAKLVLRRLAKVTVELERAGQILEADEQTIMREETVVGKTFRATIRRDDKKGGWTYVIWPESAEFLGTRKAAKVSGTVDGYAFQATFLPMGDGTHMLPMKAAILKAIKKGAGNTVEVCVSERSEPAAK